VPEPAVEIDSMTHQTHALTREGNLWIKTPKTSAQAEALLGEAAVLALLGHAHALDERAGLPALITPHRGRVKSIGELRPADVSAVVELIMADARLVESEQRLQAALASSALVPAEAYLGHTLERIAGRLTLLPDPLAARTQDWARQTMPPDLLPRLRLRGRSDQVAHGDPHLNNIVFDESSERPALIDWEQAVLGPPALSLGMFAYDLAGRSKGDRELLGPINARLASRPSETTAFAWGLHRQIVSTTTWQLSLGLEALTRQDSLMLPGLTSLFPALRGWPLPRRLPLELYS